MGTTILLVSPTMLPMVIITISRLPKYIINHYLSSNSTLQYNINILRIISNHMFSHHQNSSRMLHSNNNHEPNTLISRHSDLRKDHHHELLQ